MSQSPPNPPVDLDTLDAFLDSDRAPADCMDVSEIDGFLAALVVGPEPIGWDEALPVIWGGETPDFTDADESAVVTGTIVARHGEIATLLDTDPEDYAPVFLEDYAGTTITEDWALGFMQAVSLRADAWKPLLRDDESAMLLIPIGIMAGMADPEIRLDTGLPDGLMDELVANAESVLPACVRGLHAYWRQRRMNGVTRN
ncbi:MAG TPA: UPF0149 family protein [Acetobacteraceae bacterium]|nr:UPF0149 family protein [Acetobacteraceae bacterium]